MSSDAELIAQAQAGSAAARETLFDRYWQRVWRTAYAVAGTEDVASEIAQDTFIRAFAALSRFEHGRPVGPWLAKIAVNRALDVMRRERLQAPGRADEAVAPDPDRDWELLEAVRRLSPERRLVIGLHYWLDLGVEQIGEILELPAGTVASRLSRALAQLRHDLEAQYV